MHRFYWLIENGVAGCSRPGDQGGPTRAASPETLESDLAWLREQDIGAVLSLTETPLEQEALSRHGLDALHLPVPDLTSPLPEQFQCALDFIDRQRSMGRAVAVHCLMGQGRTGAVLAAYLIRSGMDADQAIAELRRICPGAISAQEQEAALRAFEYRRDWML